MKTSSQLSDDNRRRALLTTKKVREAINESSTPWSEMEQRIAIELIKKLVGGAPSKLLVRKIMHVVSDAKPVLLEAGEPVKLSWIELDEYVGLRLHQQRLIEQSFQAACDQVSVFTIS